MSAADQPERYFDKETQKWCYEDAAGRLYEWNEAAKQWQPSLETLRHEQQSVYGETLDQEAPDPAVLAKDRKRKQKEEAKSQRAAKKQKDAPARNTAIFVSRLPLDPPVTADELAQVFSKAGMILQDVDSNPKIKLYNDQSGNSKGEALIVFLQEESANLACEWFHETDFRPGDGQTMTVTRAEFKEKPAGAAATSNGAASTSKKSDPDKAKQAKRAEKLKKNLEGWESDDELEAKAAAAATQPKPNKLVVFKHMFTLPELEADPTLLLELKEDVREQCEGLGKVTNVVLYDQEAEGVITVRFQDDLPAKACVQKMNGRYFAGRRIEAFLSDGKTKYRKSGKSDLQDDAEEKARLDKFAEYLEGGGGTMAQDERIEPSVAAGAPSTAAATTDGP